MAKVKAWKMNEAGQPDFPTTYDVTERWEGNVTDIIKNNNKYYHAEIQVANNGQSRVYTEYGRVGKIQSRDYRYFDDETIAKKEYQKLVNRKKNKKKNPYVEVELAITAVGSSGAKEIQKAMTGIDVGGKNIVTRSKLNTEVQRLVGSWFKDTGNFIKMNLKCELGQLTVEQIEKGRKVLDECKNKVNSKSQISDKEYDNLTSMFYSLIPHVLPHKIRPEDLRLNLLDRIVKKEETLDIY